MRGQPLRLDPDVTHVVTLADLTVLVRTEGTTVLREGLAQELLPLLDGTRTAERVCEDLADRYPAAVVHYWLMALEKEGVAVAAPPPEQSGRIGASPAAAVLLAAWARRSDEHPVVRIPGKDLGVPGPDVLLTDDYLRPEVEEAVRDGEPAVLAAPAGRTFWLGPRVGPDASCPSCLARRLRMNLVGRALVRGGAEEGVRIHALTALTSPECFEAAARRLEERAPSRPGFVELEVLDPTGGRVERHPVPRLADCPACGDPTLGPPGAEIRLGPVVRRAGSGGGFRSCTPQDTWERYRSVISPLTGLVRSIRPVPVPGAEGVAHVYTASHAHHTGPVSVRAVRDEARDHSGGKGRTELDARVSALCESLERWSCVHRGTEPVRRSSLSELDGRRVAPNQLMLFSDRQFEAREVWNARQNGGFQQVPHPYEDQSIDWVQARSLVNGEAVWVPAAHVFFGYGGPGGECVAGDSNGLAGGNTVEEAVLQGFLELVERDAVALWWYTRARRPGGALPLADPWFAKVEQCYGALGRTVWLLDLTTDLEVPVYAALSALEDGGSEIIFGFGCHVSPDIAKVRAVTELNQMLPTILMEPAERTRRLLPEFQDAVTWWREATLDDHPYLTPHPAQGLPPRKETEGDDLHHHVQECVDRAAGVGLETLVYDLTRPDVGYPVVKVMAPGMRHFWRRLGPGRLYEVPPALGWVPAEIAESDVNPISMFV